jgi:hypothetical protein
LETVVKVMEISRDRILDFLDFINFVSGRLPLDKWQLLNVVLGIAILAVVITLAVRHFTLVRKISISRISSDLSFKKAKKVTVRKGRKQYTVDCARMPFLLLICKEGDPEENLRDGLKQLWQSRVASGTRQRGSRKAEQRWLRKNVIQI